MDRAPCIERENIAHPFASRRYTQQGSRVGNCRTVARGNKGQARCPAASSSCAFQTVARGSFVGVSCVLASRRNLFCRPRRFFGFLRIPAASSCLHDFRLRNLTERRADQSLYEKRILPNCLWGVGWVDVAVAHIITPYHFSAVFIKIPPIAHNAVSATWCDLISVGI